MMESMLLETPLGRLLLTGTNTAVTGLRLNADGQEPGGAPSGLLRRAAAQVEEYLAGSRRAFDLPLEPEGTEFQQKVWAALRAIPRGETRTYGQIAEAVGSPRAARAVGMACNKNPIPILIPCHRVVGAGGRLTGYAGGLDMKAALLRLETGAP